MNIASRFLIAGTLVMLAVPTVARAQQTYPGRATPSYAPDYQAYAGGIHRETNTDVWNAEPQPAYGSLCGTTIAASCPNR